MFFNDIFFDIRQFKIPLRIAQSSIRMVEAMKAVRRIRIMPVIEKIIMQQRTAINSRSLTFRCNFLQRYKLKQATATECAYTEVVPCWINSFSICIPFE